jgi:hypothetical protein
MITAIIQEALADCPNSQDRLIKLLLSKNDSPHVKSIGLSVLRNLLLATFFEVRRELVWLYGVSSGLTFPN